MPNTTCTITRHFKRNLSGTSANLLLPVFNVECRELWLRGFKSGKLDLYADDTAICVTVSAAQEMNMKFKSTNHMLQYGFNCN